MSLDTVLTLLFLVVFVVLPLVSRILRERNRRAAGQTGTGGAPKAGRPTEGTPGAGPGRQADAEQVPPWLAEAQRRVQEARARTTAEASARPSAEAPARGGALVPEDAFGPAARPSAGRALVPEDASTQRRARGLVPEDPFESGLVGREEERRAGPGLGREGVPAERLPAPARAEPRLEPRPVRREGAPSPEPAAVERGHRRRARRARSEAHLEAEAEVIVEAMAAYGRPPGGTVGARLDVVGLLRFDREAIVSGLIWHEILDEPAWKRRRGRALSRPRSR
ncbi:MAG: hypothetical protein P8Y02_00580 [Deinococcales bacterium]